VRFELYAAHIRTDFRCGSCALSKKLEPLFKSMQIPYVIRDVKVLDEQKKTNCFWCSWNRRKALFKAAQELGCQKLAFGHHKDDIVETVLMNLLFNGNIAAMNPRQELFKGKLVLIRPLCYVDESMTRRFAKENGWGDMACQCPFGNDSKRKYIKDFIRETEKTTGHTNIRTNIFNSIARIKEDYIDLKMEADTINEDVSVRKVTAATS
jgi:tRNA 2-thiocytidine biosynthesis protein TtcA